MSPTPPRSRPRLAPPPARLSGRTPGLSALSAVVLTLVVALATPACGSSRPDQASVPVDTTPAAASTGATSPDAATSDLSAAVLARYQEFWQVWLRANNPPNPDYPDLDRYYTGRQLDGARTTILDRQMSGQVVSLPPGSKYAHHASVTVYPNGASANVIDCAIDDSVVIVEATGAVVNSELVAQLINAEMVLIDGAWKVSAVTFVKEWPGETECAIG